MKKLCMFMALLLTVLLPVSAFAETADAYVVRLSNPSATIGGATISLNDFAVQGAYIKSDLAEHLILDLIMRGETTHSAMLQVNDTHILGLLGGMGSAYALSFDDLASIMETPASEPFSYEDWTLPGELEAIIENAAFTVTGPEPGTDANGMAKVYFEICGELDPIIRDMLVAIENDELAGGFLAAIDPGTSIVEEFDDDIYDYYLSGRMGFNADDSAMDGQFFIDTRYTGTTDVDCYAVIDVISDATVPGVSTLDIAVSSFDGDETLESTMSMTAVFENGKCNVAYDAWDSYTTTNGTIVCSFSDTLDSFELTETDTYSDGSTSTVTISGKNVKSANGHDIDVALTYEDTYSGVSTVTFTSDLVKEDEVTAYACSVGYSDEYEASILNIVTVCDLSTGDCRFTLTFDDGYNPVSMALALESIEPRDGMEYSGILSILIDDGYDTILYSADVDCFTAGIDPNAFYIDPESAVDISSMTDEQSETAAEELETFFESIGKAFENSYPILFELLDW